MTPKVTSINFIGSKSQFVSKLERLLNEKQIDMVASLLIQYATRATPSYGKFGGDFFSVILLRNYPSLIIKMLKLKNDQLNQALLITVCEGLKAFGPDWRKYTSLERSGAVEAVLAATHPADIRDLNGGFASKALRRFAADETIPAILFLSDMAFMQSIGDSCNTPEDVATLRHLVDREMNKVLQDNPANIASIRAMGQGYVVALRSAIRFTGQRGPEGMALLLLQKIFDFPLPELRLVTLTKRSMHKELSGAPALAEQPSA